MIPLGIATFLLGSLWGIALVAWGTQVDLSPFERVGRMVSKWT